MNYQKIYEQYAKKLFLQGLQFTSDRELIRDCIHDVFVKIYKNQSALSSVQNIEIYLFVSLRNSIIASLGKKKILFEELDNGLEENHTAGDFTIEDDLINREVEEDTKKLINKLLSFLTTRQREAVHYRFFEGMEIDEISKIMDMNYQSVQNLLQRSLKKINESMKKI
jgi:RNA polymerase sigma factor (sigma-70 family)